MLTRVLFIYHVSTIGGGSFCLLNLLKAIDRNIFEPVVLLPNKGLLCDEIAKLGIEITYFPPLVLYPYNESLFNYSTLKTLYRIKKCQKAFSETIKSIAPDVVYMNTMMLFPYLKTVKQQGCKTVIHIREHWPLEEHCKQLERARKIVYGYADKMIAINRYSASIFPRKESTIVYDWIDMEARRGGASLSSLLGEDSTNKRVYLFTGGLQPIKGTLEVLTTFTNYIKGDDRRLLVLGVDPVMNWAGIKGIIKKLLSCLGYKTYKEKVVELCRNDERIVCAPATYNITDIMEHVAGNVSYFTIPHANLALAESIILEIPTVAASTDESMEYSYEGQLALLYEFGNIKSFEETWRLLDKGEKNIKEVLSKQSKIVKDIFNPEKNSQKFNELLKTLAISKVTD